MIGPALRQDALIKKARLCRRGHWKLSQPPRDRRAETLLRPVEDVFGQTVAERVLQYPLAHALAQFDVDRQAPCELNHLVVEKRSADFERFEHRAAIRLHEDVVRQI